MARPIEDINVDGIEIVPESETDQITKFDSWRQIYKRQNPDATDEDALNAYKMVKKFEKLNPSLEPSHAFSEAIKIAPKLSKDTIIIVNSCGDAKKDKDILKKRLGEY